MRCRWRPFRSTEPRCFAIVWIWIQVERWQFVHQRRKFTHTTNHRCHLRPNVDIKHVLHWIRYIKIQDRTRRFLFGKRRKMDGKTNSISPTVVYEITIVKGKCFLFLFIKTKCKHFSLHRRSSDVPHKKWKYLHSHLHTSAFHKHTYMNNWRQNYFLIRFKSHSYTFICIKSHCIAPLQHAMHRTLHTNRSRTIWVCLKSQMSLLSCYLFGLLWL